MPPEVAPLLHTCPKCGALLDVTEQEPFSEIACPSCNTAMRVRTRFDHYELLEFVASGGMGSVYKARDLNLNRVIALKLLRKEFSADADYIEKLETEAKITASVTHSNVVQVFSFGCDQGVYYIAMELVDKGSLDDLMNLQQRIAEAQVLEIGSQVAQGLRAAYQAGLIHRDVKPGNILFADAHTAKIVDFGLAMPLEQAQEGEEDIWGTPYYVAPEKLNHEPEDFRSDIYSLGGTLFHALAGRPPFEAENASLVALKHLKSQVVSLQAFAPDVSSPTAYVINRTLAKNPDDRYQSYDELIEHLEYARTQLLETAGSARQPKARVVLEDEKQQNVLGYIMIGMLAFTLIVGIVLYCFRDVILRRNSSVEELARQQMEHSINSGEQALAAARKAFIKGNYEEGLKLLKPVEARPNLLEPLKSTLALHKCIGSLLAGEFWNASQIMRGADIDFVRGLAVDEQRRHFLGSIKAVFGSRENVFFMPPNGTANSVEPAACLLIGLKEWDASRFGIADSLFQRFLETKPSGAWSWLEDFKPLAEQYRGDYRSFAPLEERIRAASSDKDRAAIVSQIAGVKAKLKLPGRLPELLAFYEKSMRAEKQASPDFGGQRGEVPLPVIHARVMTLLGELMPAEARSLLQSTNVAGGDSAKQSLLRKVGFIQDFKNALINDLPQTSAGMRWVGRRSGPWIFGTIVKANDAQIVVRSNGRDETIPWSDILPATILVWADSIGNASKLWYSGVYAFAAGYPKEGLLRMKQGAEIRPEYRSDIAGFESTR